jgi:hypothetical protein
MWNRIKKFFRRNKTITVVIPLGDEFKDAKIGEPVYGKFGHELNINVYVENEMYDPDGITKEMGRRGLL